MCRWRITTSESVLWLVVLFLTRHETSGTMSSPGTHDKNHPLDRRTLCERTNSCAACEEARGPRCLNHDDPLLGADLCDCCFSCVAFRDLGESCGSQLSTWPEVPWVGPVSSSVTILATTWCKEGLVCVDFVCLDPSGDLESRIKNKQRFFGSVRNDDAFERDMIQFRAGQQFPNHDERDFPRIISSTSSTPSSSAWSSTGLKKIRITSIVLSGKRFQLLYSRDMLSELRVLLDVVDIHHQDSLLDEKLADSLLEHILGTTYAPDVGALTPSETLPRPRKNREVEMTEGDTGFPPPGNIQGILMRGASAHKEYVGGARSFGQSPEVTSQEEESTVRLHITNRPRKIHTLVDLEEEDAEDEHDEIHHNLHQAGRGQAGDTGKDEQIGASPGSTTEANQDIQAKTAARARPQIISQTETASSTKALATLDDRLTLVEIRVNFFERVLEEMSRWSNFEVSSMPGDCSEPQTSETRYGQKGPDTDEHLVLASRVAPVRIRGSRRKPNGNMQGRGGLQSAKMESGTSSTVQDPGIVTQRRMLYPGRNDPFNRHLFRTLISAGTPRRHSAREHRGQGRPVKWLCGNPGGQDSSWREPSTDPIYEIPAHRTVQRSVSSVNPPSNNFSGLNERVNLQETQILEPGTSKKVVRVFQDPKKRESPPHKNISPEQWTSAIEMPLSGDLAPWKMSILDETKKGEDEGTPFSRRFTKRAVSRLVRIQPPQDTLRTSRTESSIATSQTEKLFKPEATLDSDVHRNWSGSTKFTKDLVQRKVAGPLIAVPGTNDFRSSPEPTTSVQLLFSTSDPLHTMGPKVSTGPTILEDARNPTDSNAASYSTTNHGNSTIQMEEISETEYVDSLPQANGSSNMEDDFDHMYESVDADVEDGDFEYDVGYDEVEYVDGSSVEMETDVPVRVEESEMGLKTAQGVSRDGILSMIFPDELIRRVPKKEDGQCKSARGAKREIPLLLFGSTGKHEPKTIVWPSKWTGYRRDRILGSGRLGDQGSSPNSKPPAIGSLPITTPSSLPKKTTENSTIQHRLGNENAGYVITPRISGLDRRARKNRRKLVWRR